ncbi:MAG: hypothetical protein Fur0022_05600 [Anaerolineales bacterium]
MGDVPPTPFFGTHFSLSLSSYDIRYIGDEVREGMYCRKYVIDGTGLDYRGGAIWVEKQGEYFVDVEIDLPDNPNWESFKFKL